MDIFYPGFSMSGGRKDFGRVLVNHFETLVAQHLGLPSQLCIYNEVCGKGLAIEHDGSVYSCDHYVYPEYRLGTIWERPSAELAISPEQVKFGFGKSETLPRYCRECPYLADCWGECPKNRLIRTPDGEPGLNYLCAGLKKFYKHALPEIEQIAAGIRQRSEHPRAFAPKRRRSTKPIWAASSPDAAVYQDYRGQADWQTGTKT